MVINMPLMPAHGRFQEFEGRNYVYGVKFQGSQTTQRNPVSKRRRERGKEKNKKKGKGRKEKEREWNRAWWCTSLIPALGRQRQADF